jgi:pilus assembly protein Flp/PilA
MRGGVRRTAAAYGAGFRRPRSILYRSLGSSTLFDATFDTRRTAMIRKFLKDESGATAIEYGLIAALVAIACIVALEAMGTSLSGMFNGVKGKLDAKKPT